MSKFTIWMFRKGAYFITCFVNIKSSRGNLLYSFYFKLGNSKCCNNTMSSEPGEMVDLKTNPEV